MSLRPAIAMIELIFAIVVIGIVLMSAPMLISTATQSSYLATQQEAIGEASSHMNMILNYHWDEGDANETYDDHILRVGVGHPDLSEFSSTGRRVGTPSSTKRTFIREDGNSTMQASTTLGSEGGYNNDIDDFQGNSFLINVDPSDSDYIEGKSDIKINTFLTYISDNLISTNTYQNPGASRKINFNATLTPPGGTTNIKHIVVTLTDTSGVKELKKTIALKAFSCNVGSYSLAEKDY